MADRFTPASAGDLPGEEVAPRVLDDGLGQLGREWLDSIQAHLLYPLFPTTAS